MHYSISWNTFWIDFCHFVPSPHCIVGFLTHQEKCFKNRISVKKTPFFTLNKSLYTILYLNFPQRPHYLIYLTFMWKKLHLKQATLFVVKILNRASHQQTHLTSQVATHWCRKIFSSFGETRENNWEYFSFLSTSWNPRIWRLKLMIQCLN